jgi:hypothetical protein
LGEVRHGTMFHTYPHLLMVGSLPTRWLQILAMLVGDGLTAGELGIIATVHLGHVRQVRGTHCNEGPGANIYRVAATVDGFIEVRLVNLK